MKKIILALLVTTALISYATAHNDDPNHAKHKTTVGYPALAKEATQTIHVSLTDKMEILFKEELAAINAPKTIHFIVTNQGKIRHEFSIGNEQEQAAHRAMMQQMPNMVHEDANTITLEPGETKTITWHFEGIDTVVFACNIPGHYEAGMFKKVALKTE